MSKESKPLQGYIITKKTRLQSVVVVPEKRQQSQVKRHKVELTPNAKKKTWAKQSSPAVQLQMYLQNKKGTGE